MAKTKTILITGGAGFIGSHVNKLLHQSGYETIVLDNLSRGSSRSLYYGTFHLGDVGDAVVLEHIFKMHRIDAVMHFAALIDVGESTAAPALYYKNNVTNLLPLLETMVRFHVSSFVFSSSAAVYGNPISIPLTEEHPTAPINPYGRTKLMGEMILQDYSSAYGLRYSSLRYFNAAGGDPDGEIKNHKPHESNLVPMILRSLLNPHSHVTIYGSDYPTPDGTCIRDYIHIYDLGTAHLLALETLLNGAHSSIYNLGNGRGFSVKEVIATAEKVTGVQANLVRGERRPGDPAILLADASKAKKELGWIPRYPEIETIIADAWKSYSEMQKA